MLRAARDVRYWRITVVSIAYSVVIQKVIAESVFENEQTGGQSTEKSP